MADDERTALLDGIERDLAGVDHALARLESGTYLVCEVCAGPIDPDVLVADPTSTRCARCAASADATGVGEVGPAPVPAPWPADGGTPDAPTG